MHQTGDHARTTSPAARPRPRIVPRSIRSPRSLRDSLFALGILFFAFPLLAPAINDTVVYPYIFLGVALLPSLRLTPRHFCIFVAAASLLGVICLFDLSASARVVAFYVSCLFLCRLLNDDGYRELLFKAACVHAMIVIVQFTLLFIDVEIDFSVILRAIYGSLLPGTGSHIDYNAFSQLDFYFPRVAGLNREPAFAAVLFLGFCVISLIERHFARSLLFAAATICSLSKIVIVLLPVYLTIMISTRIIGRQTSGAVASRFALFIASQFLVLAAIGHYSEFIRELAALDASFYHRFIGLVTLATEPEKFNLLGSSWASLSKLGDLSDYEFVNFQRGFFDGSVVPKMITDFGYLSALVYAMTVAVLARNWVCVLAVSFGGIFVNLLSVSPATVLTFVMLCGLGYRIPPRATQAAVRRRRLAAPPPVLATMVIDKR